MDSISWNRLKKQLQSCSLDYTGEITGVDTCPQIPDCPVNGNGAIAGAMDCHGSRMNFYLTKSDFWTPVFNEDLVFARYRFSPSPLGGVTLDFGQNGDYVSGQDLSDASIHSTVTLKNGTVQVTAVAPWGSRFYLIGLRAEGQDACVGVHIWTKADGGNHFALSGTENNILWAVKEHKSFITVNAGMAADVLGADCCETCYDPEILEYKSFCIKAGTQAWVAVNVQGGRDSFDHREKAIAAVRALTQEQIPALLEASRAHWEEYWMRSFIWFGEQDRDIMRYYFGALYVLGTGVDPDNDTPPGIAGPWIHTNLPIWGGNYTMNYNGEAPFWSVFSANRPELSKPYIRVCRDFVGTAKELAREMKTRGIVFPVMIEPWGISDNCDSLYQKSNSSLAAISMIWYYEYTLDEAYLKDTLYPFLLECMDFWEDNLEWLPEGRYAICDAAVRERTPGDQNPINDLGYLRHVMSAAVRCSTHLGRDPERRAQWQKYLDYLSDYPSKEYEGILVFKEAENKMDMAFSGIGDNPVVLDHVYPAEALDIEESPLLKIIARNTIKTLKAWNQPNGFPRIYSQAVRAEYDPQEILSHFKYRLTLNQYPHEILRKNCTFISQYHAMEAVGCIEFLNSMLAQANDGILRVFRVWDKSRDISFERIRVKGAFLVSSSMQNGQVGDVKVESLRGGRCRFLNPWKGKITVTCDGLAVNAEDEKGISTFETEAGKTYLLRQRETPEIRSTDKVIPLKLYAVIDRTVKDPRDGCEADLDILLTRKIPETKLCIMLLMSDGSCVLQTEGLRFRSADPEIVSVNGEGVITGVAPGRTDICAVLENTEFSCHVSVQVMHTRIISGIRTSCCVPASFFMAELPNTVNGNGMDSPDVTAHTRMNPYGFGQFCYRPRNVQDWIELDLQKVYALDELWIWNLNCPDDNYRKLWWIGGTGSGMRDVNIRISEDGERWEDMGIFRFARASGLQNIPATNLDLPGNPPVRFGGRKARYVRLMPELQTGIGNWGGHYFGLNKLRITYFE